MRQSRYAQLVRKAAAAATGAIEIYNHPRSTFREDTFCILLVTAWELLLKARILLHNNNALSSIEVHERRTNKSGVRSQRKYVRRGRSGNPLTIGIKKCMEIVPQYGDMNIDQNCVKNIEALIEIRDNSVHFMNKDSELSKIVYEIGAASLLNFLRAIQSWFGADLDEFGFVPLPISYYPVEQISTVAMRPIERNAQSQRLVEFLKEVALGQDKTEGSFHSAINVDVRFVKTGETSAIPFRVSKDPNAKEVRLTEEDIRSRYPLEYYEVRRRICRSLPGIKVNREFNSVMHQIAADPACCWERYLHPGNPRSSIKRFYSERCVTEFERLWRERNVT